MTANTSPGEFSLLYKVPAVLRARDYRLYLKSGQRLVDLWLNGGAAILGHTPPNVLREIKNTASRGLFAPFPHFTEERYTKSLSKLLPGYCFRLYSAPPLGLETLFKNGAAGLWRPFIDLNSPFLITSNSPSILIPVLPGIQSWRNNLPLGLCVLAAQSDSLLAELPVSEILPPVLLAAAARGVYDIIASPERTKLNYPRIFKALQNSKWERQGVYLNLKDETQFSPSEKSAEWETLFNQFLEAGFLLPPTPSQPLILPGGLSDGEEARLARCLSGT